VSGLTFSSFPQNLVSQWLGNEESKLALEAIDQRTDDGDQSTLFGSDQNSQDADREQTQLPGHFASGGLIDEDSQGFKL
jgi:hypothetical protein